MVSDRGRDSRRALLGRVGATLAGAGLLGLAGCGARAKVGRGSVENAPAAVKQSDVEILTGLLELERRTVAAYTASVPLLGRPDAHIARQFLAEELQHTGELLSLIKAAGGKPVPRPASFDLGHPTGRAGVLELLHTLERLQITAYLDAIPRLSPASVRAAASSILANDAQHVAIIRQSRGMTAVPAAFLTATQ